MTELFSITIAFISMLIALRSSPFWKDIRYNKKREITWNRFWESFTSKNFIGEGNEEQFDIIIGVNDGIVPASMLVVNNYGVELYYCETLKSEKGKLWKSEKFKEKKSKVFFPNNKTPEVNGKNILIVDDNFLTGSSMLAVMEFLEEIGEPKSISCKALFQYQNADKPSLKLNLKIGEFIDPKYSHTKQGIKVFRAPWSVSKTHKRRYLRGSSKED